MTRLIVETVVHTAVLPGTVIVVIPYLLVSAEPFSLAPWPLEILGIASGLAGIVLGLWCTRHFVVVGQGTPNPLDPPKFLVRGGPYRVVRNPMYTAVGLILAAEALILGSATLLIYLCIVMVCFHLFVLIYEEPTLARLFGSSYDDYRRQVPRWWPRAV